MADYIVLKEQIKTLFKGYVSTHTLKECEKYYYQLEEISQEDALLFALCIAQRYFAQFESDFYDHIGTMVFHNGNNAMLLTLLTEQLSSSNNAVKEYCQTLIENITAGLQQTAREEFIYDKAYLDTLRNTLQNSN